LERHDWNTFAVPRHRASARLARQLPPYTRNVCRYPEDMP
jgi:hypothetical protein